MNTESLEAQLNLLHTWKSKRILVVGDFILDHHIYGTADRLSPDAPVPVLAIVREDRRPGGSSNVALDLQALHCKAVCLGVIGEDDAGRTLRQSLDAAGCDTAGLLVMPGRPTTLKQNYVVLAQQRHPQKMFRVDQEDRTPIDEAAARKIIELARKKIKGAAALCLEDYNKGVLTPFVCQALIKIARRAGVPVFVDPAAISDYRKYRGATCITPNRIEAAAGARMSPATTDIPGLTRMAHKLQRELKLEVCVLTLDKQGILYLKRGEKPVHAPTVAREVYDVTGAGDMFLAVLAAARANGADWHCALQLANTAAGSEVEKFGVVPIPLDELRLDLVSRGQENHGKLRALIPLARELAAHRSVGKRIVFTNGCFDVLHAGHISLLKRARELGDILVLGLNSDASVRRIKGAPRPLLPLDQRLLILNELSCIDYLVVFEEDRPLKLLKTIKPEILVKGEEYRPRDVAEAQVVKGYGGEVRILSHRVARETRRILEAMREVTPDGL